MIYFLILTICGPAYEKKVSKNLKTSRNVVQIHDTRALPLNPVVRVSGGKIMKYFFNTVRLFKKKPLTVKKI